MTRLNTFLSDLFRHKIKVEDSASDSNANHRLAGTVGLLWAEPARFSAEIGHLMTLPAFQRTYVTSNAIGLLALLCLSDPAAAISMDNGKGETLDKADDHGREMFTLGPYDLDGRKPSVGPSSPRGRITGGLGLRRVQYQSHPLNIASVRAAERLGFKLEGITRWQRAVSLGKETVRRAGDAPDVLGGWHSTGLAMCFDDWDAEVIYTVMTPR